MDGGDVALAALGGCKPAGAADIERLDRDPFGFQPSDQHVEPDTVAADDDEIGEVSAADQLHLDRVPAGTLSTCWPIAMKPSAWLKAITAPEPLELG
jgi:hypothetical protein